MIEQDRYNFLLTKPKPEIMWDIFPYSKSKIYKLIFYDFLNWEPSSFNTKTRYYMVFNCCSLDTIEDLGIKKDFIFRLHIPYASLQIAWNNVFKPFDDNNFPNKDEITNCEIHFKRLSKKKLNIIYFKELNRLCNSRQDNTKQCNTKIGYTRLDYTSNNELIIDLDEINNELKKN